MTIQDEEVAHKELVEGKHSDQHFHSCGVFIILFESDADVVVGDGKVAFTIPAFMNGMDLIDVVASCHTKGTVGTTDVQVRRRRAGAEVDMLSTKITMGDEYYCSDETVDPNNDDVQTGDQIYCDVDAIRTGMKGLSIVSTFRKVS